MRKTLLAIVAISFIFCLGDLPAQDGGQQDDGGLNDFLEIIKNIPRYLKNGENGLQEALKKMEEGERAEFEKILRKCEAATVRIDGSVREIKTQTGEKSKSRSGGSGVLVDDGKYVVTAGHVATDGGEIDIDISDGRRFKAKVVKHSSRPDLAIAEVVNPKSEKLPSLDLGSPLEKGDFAMILGYPAGHGKVKGQIRLVVPGREFGTPMTILGKAGTIFAGSGGFQFYSTVGVPLVACVMSGNSGGPVVNKKGEVVGIIVAGGTAADGPAVCVSVTDIKKFLDK